jgi:hypothetical protein
VSWRRRAQSKTSPLRRRPCQALCGANGNQSIDIPPIIEQGSDSHDTIYKGSPGFFDTPIVGFGLAVIGHGRDCASADPRNNLLLEAVLGRAQNRGEKNLDAFANDLSDLQFTVAYILRTIPQPVGPGTDVDIGPRSAPYLPSRMYIMETG